MDHTAATEDVLDWIPAPALRLERGEVAGANAAAIAMLGAPHDVLASLSDPDRAALLDAVGAVERGEPVDAVVVRTGGTTPVRFVELQIGRHPSGGVTAVAHEVTERERLDAVIAEFATGVYVTDAELRATWIPRRVSESVGLPRERFVGSDVYERLHPDDVEPTRALVARARELPGVRCSRPMRVRQFDQPDVWWPIVTHLVWRGDDPAIGGLLVRFDVDPTAGVDERDAELTAQSLVTLASSSTTGALHLDLDGTLLQRSTRVREILRPVGDDGDQRWLDLLRPEDRKAVRARLDAARAGTLLPAVEVAFVSEGARAWAASTRCRTATPRGTSPGCSSTSWTSPPSARRVTSSPPPEKSCGTWPTTMR
ncbi:hypothetical protein ACE2AJ_14150 [Aquihabitans daechungensis]|uniref:hypothetical protein n=1 Tax=Aquihabitans daechungensis TaxID=1052257 RepID=UPI003BA20618